MYPYKVLSSAFHANNMAIAQNFSITTYPALNTAMHFQLELQIPLGCMSEQWVCNIPYWIVWAVINFDGNCASSSLTHRSVHMKSGIIARNL